LEIRLQWTEAKFELAHCRVNVESENKVMGTTAAIIDSTLITDRGSRDKLGQEMGDALLRYRPVFYRSAQTNRIQALLVQDGGNAEHRDDNR
jgi:hypothetical protein